MPFGADVRSISGIPVTADFAGTSGTPVVIDTDTGYGYALRGDGVVVQIYSPETMQDVLVGRSFISVPALQSFQNSEDIAMGRAFIRQNVGPLLYQAESPQILAGQVFGA